VRWCSATVESAARRQAEERKRELDFVCRGRELPADAGVELISPPPIRAVAGRGKDSPKRLSGSAGVRKADRKKIVSGIQSAPENRRVGVAGSIVGHFSRR
jgi:hypothetical protein